MRVESSADLARQRPARLLSWLLISSLPMASPAIPTAASDVEAPPGAVALESDRVDGVHRDLAADIAPIEQGLVTVQLRPSNPVLEVANHELLLWPVEGGLHGARLTARFRGEAELQADIEIAGLSAQMTDLVELPDQETRLEGKFRITREQEGYRVVAEELPRFVELSVKSRLAGQMVTLCRSVALLAPGGGTECEGLDRLLSAIRLPMPEPGETYFIAAGQLTRHERAQVDSYLDRE